jgi:hypothetical protein
MTTKRRQATLKVVFRKAKVVVQRRGRKVFEARDLSSVNNFIAGWRDAENRRDARQ